MRTLPDIRINGEKIAIFLLIGKKQLLHFFPWPPKKVHPLYRLINKSPKNMVKLHSLKKKKKANKYTSHWLRSYNFKAMQWQFLQVSFSWKSGHLEGKITNTELNKLVQTKYILRFLRYSFFWHQTPHLCQTTSQQTAQSSSTPSFELWLL